MSARRQSPPEFSVGCPGAPPAAGSPRRARRTLHGAGGAVAGGGAGRRSGGGCGVGCRHSSETGRRCGPGARRGCPRGGGVVSTCHSHSTPFPALPAPPHHVKRRRQPSRTARAAPSARAVVWYNHPFNPTIRTVALWGRNPCKLPC